jgi:acetolactate synthase-1/2/3 large subunit
MMGISALPTEHELFCGMIGMHGKETANRAINECDLLILLGARVNDRAVLALKHNSKLKVIHIDIDPAEIGKNLPATIPVVGDSGAVLEQIIRIANDVNPNRFTEWVEHLKELKSQENFDIFNDDICINPYSNTVNPKMFIQVLNGLIPENTIIAADVGQNQIWTANRISLGEHGRFITSGGMGTMGYSLPAAIGAKKAVTDGVSGGFTKPAGNGFPENCEVIVICGDGSFQMQAMELATAVQHNITVKIIIMKNNRLGMVRELQQDNYGGNITAVELDGSPDFIKLASAYGINGDYVNSLDTATQALITLLASKKPYVLQVSVDENERSLNRKGTVLKS